MRLIQDPSELLNHLLLIFGSVVDRFQLEVLLDRVEALASEICPDASTADLEEGRDVQIVSGLQKLDDLFLA